MTAELAPGGAGSTVSRQRDPARSRWSVIAAYGVLCAAAQVLWVTYAPVTADAAAHFGVSETTIGWLAQVFPLVYVLVAVPAGVFLDRFLRGGLFLGAALTAAGGLVRLASDDFTWALIGQGIAALGQPFVLNAVTGLTAGYLAERDRANGIAVASAATFAGIVAGFAIGAALPGSSNVHVITATTALVGLVAAVLMAVALRHRPDRPTSSPGGFAAFRVAWRDRYLRRLCAVVFVPFGTFIALTTFIQPLLEPAGVSASTAGLILVVNVIAGVAACAVVPVWADRRRREAGTIALGVLVTAGACLLLGLAPGTLTGVIAMTVVGLTLLPTLPIVLSLTEKHATQTEGTAAGFVWLSGNLGGLVIASVIGLLVGRPGLAFVTLALTTLGALPTIAWLTKLHDRPDPGRC